MNIKIRNKGTNEIKKQNAVARLNHRGGLIGLIAGSSKGKLQGKVEEMNQRGWNTYFIHSDQPNILIWLRRFIILFLTLGLWTIGNSELLVFEREEK